VTDHYSSQKQVRRAGIVLLTAYGCGTMEIMCRAYIAKTAVWRWQDRFLSGGIPGMSHDTARP
jgi:hypothetical protein